MPKWQSTFEFKVGTKNDSFHLPSLIMLQMPQTTQSLSHLSAGALLTIDLAAARANYRRLCTIVGLGVETSAVVKANAYGLGAVPVAQALWDEGCRTFFVAHLAEGLELRKALGQRAVIYVLNGLPPGAEPLAADANLRPVLNALADVLAWSALAKTRRERLSGALQVDSGMARLGLCAEDVDRLAAKPELLDGISVTLVMSHLACADTPRHPANRAQLEAFRSLAALLPNAPRSLANSSGIFLGAEYHFDLVRPGLALYGGNATPSLPNPMRPVVSLCARVLQTRTVRKGAGVGYGLAHVTDNEARLAVISTGYADGWMRSLSGKGAVFLDGYRLPVVGRVSMDSVIIDTTMLPPDLLSAGTLVNVIGPHQTVDQIAQDAGTIPYEILTSLGDRYHRTYLA